MFNEVSQTPAPRAPRSTELARALHDWAQALSVSQIATDPATLARYGRSLSGTPNPPAAVLYPESTEQVAALVKIAAKHKVPLHPISGGRNWGYGDACAAEKENVIVDLGRMNRILEVNAELAYAVVEPGVTQGQLWERLAGTGLWMDATGAGPQASLVGNFADRGFGHTRYGDHFASCCELEVVLGDGRVVRTGYGHYSNAKAKNVFRYGVGPIVDGLFTQSNFGIITRMTLWLMPAPQNFRAFFFICERDEDLPELVEKLRKLRLDGVVTSSVHIANDLRVVSSKESYPWKLTGGEAPLPPNVRAALRKRYQIGAWNGCGAITGPKEIVEASSKIIRRELRKFRPMILSPAQLRLGSALLRATPKSWFRGFKEKLTVVHSTFDMLQGKPVSDHLNGVYWRSGKPPIPVSDPLHSNAGLLWISPILPMAGAQADRVREILEQRFTAHGFEPLITLTAINDRALCCVSNISFDRSVAGESERAKACYDDVMGALAAEGYYPYRTGPQGFAKLQANSDEFWSIAAELKKVLDPQGVLSPGRYGVKKA